MKNLNNLGLQAVSADEAVSVIGGIDKGAQETLYIIGYVIELTPTGERQLS